MPTPARCSPAMYFASSIPCRCSTWWDCCSCSSGKRHLRLGDLAAGTVIAMERAPFLEKLRSSRQEWHAVRQRAASLSRRRGSNARDALAVVDDYRRVAHEVGSARLAHAARSRSVGGISRCRLLGSARHHPPARAASGTRIAVPDARPRACRHERHARAPAGGHAAVRRLGGRRRLAGVQLSRTSSACLPSPKLIATVERGELWTDGLFNVTPSAVMSVALLTNNIVVSFFAFCSGIVFGLGTFYLIGMNGLSLGAILRVHRAARSRRPAVRFRGRPRLRGAVVHLHRRRGGRLCRRSVDPARRR